MFISLDENNSYFFKPDFPIDFKRKGPLCLHTQLQM